MAVVKSMWIGIAGLSGSGKTALAQQLAAQLEDACEIVTIDCYYNSQSHLHPAERAQVNYDHPSALDWNLLIAHLDALSRGEPIDEPQYLFDQHTRDSRTRPIQPKSFLILEGILALHHPSVRARLDRKIFVGTDPEECLRRRLERDIRERGRTRESVLEQYRNTVWPMALEYVLPSREFADLVVSGEEPLDCSVETVLKSLQRSVVASAD